MGTSALFRRFDAARALPRLGGMARPNGVVIVSERYWAFACTDGTLREGTMPEPPAFLRNVPLARGLVRLAASVSPLFRRTGTTGRRERKLLALALVAPLGFVFLPGSWATVAGLVTTGLLLAVLFRGRTLNLHGAEHRAIAAAEERRLADTWSGVARPSRISQRCGTNFAAIALPVTLAFDRLSPLPVALYTPFVVLVFSLALSMELWLAVQRCSSRVRGAVLLPGLLLQRLTTREPRIEETQLALTAVASVLRRELAD
ncbi:MAG: DUF1385 domain-containing protein [Actinobacteria bacterium]|nr:DUF1385 domain-containing protein [Actinomycetota bacterium]